jgi:glucosylceramidase
MRFDPADRARFLKEALGPALAARRQAVGVLDYDHNWDRPQDPLAVLADPAAARHVAGVAWHCYGGNPDAMEQVRAAHPDKDVFFTECSGGDWSPDWGDTLAWMTDSLVIAATRSGSRGTLLWNLALDETHGPHLGGCGDCRGVLTVNSMTGAVTRNVEYYVLGQVSRFVPPGSVKIASTGEGPVKHVAFRTPDRRLVLLAHNASKAATALSVRIAGRGFAASIAGGDVMTFVWPDRRPSN